MKMSLCLFLLPDGKNHLPENLSAGLWKKGTWPGLSHPPACMDKVCVEVVVSRYAAQQQPLSAPQATERKAGCILSLQKGRGHGGRRLTHPSAACLDPG